MNEKDFIINKELLKSFGRNLRAERSRAGLSQDELGEKIGIDGRHISKIERGLVNTKLTTIIAILDVLEIPFDKLYIKINSK